MLSLNKILRLCIMSELNSKDYLAILKFYGIDTKKMTLRDRRTTAKEVLANKLCRCVKKIGTEQESRSIAICKNSIFTNKGLTVGRFKCKKGAMLIPSKSGQTILKRASQTRKKHR